MTLRFSKVSRDTESQIQLAMPVLAVVITNPSGVEDIDQGSGQYR